MDGLIDISQRLPWTNSEIQRRWQIRGVDVDKSSDSVEKHACDLPAKDLYWSLLILTGFPWSFTDDHHFPPADFLGGRHHLLTGRWPSRDQWAASETMDPGVAASWFGKNEYIHIYIPIIYRKPRSFLKWKSTNFDVLQCRIYVHLWYLSKCCIYREKCEVYIQLVPGQHFVYQQVIATGTL